MVAVLLAVVDVGSVCFALDAHLLVPGHVAELDGHQGLQVVGLQQLAVVRVVLQGEAVAQAEVLDLPDLVGVLVSLCATKVNAGLECSLLTNVLRDNTTAVTAGCRLLKTYLICAVNGDQVLLCFGLQSLWKRLVVGGGLKKKRERPMRRQSCNPDSGGGCGVHHFHLRCDERRPIRTHPNIHNKAVNINAETHPLSSPQDHSSPSATVHFVVAQLEAAVRDRRRCLHSQRSEEMISDVLGVDDPLSALSVFFFPANVQVCCSSSRVSKNVQMLNS